MLLSQINPEILFTRVWDNGDKFLEQYSADLVIVNYNTRKYLSDCLQSIKANTDTTTGYRVWVVDNGSTDGSISVIKAHESWVSGIFNRKNRGYAAACNQGIWAGTGSYIFLLNSDIRVTSGWLAPLIDTLKSSSRIAVVGPRLINPEGKLVGVGVVGDNAHPVMRGWYEPNEPDRYNDYTECLSICGACMGIKRQLLPELGFFDEHYFHYFEETDYCYNARFHGYQVIYCPKSTVIHQVSGSCRDSQCLNRYYREGQTYFRKKWERFLQDETKYGPVIVSHDTGQK